jgi:hypothetical protein
VSLVCLRQHEELSGRSCFEPARAKKIGEILISTNKLSMVVHACNPNYAGSISKRITEQGQAWAKM